jgi:hypothetical protein
MQSYPTAASALVQMGPVGAAQMSTSHQRREAAFETLARPAFSYDFHCPEGYKNCGSNEWGTVCASGCQASTICNAKGPSDPRGAGDGLVPVAHPAPPGMGWCGGKVQNFVPAGQNFSRECMGEMPPSRPSGVSNVNF